MKKKSKILLFLIIIVMGSLWFYKTNYKVISIDYVEKYVSESSTETTTNISDFCKDTNVLHAIYTIKNILLVAKVSVPLILIILVTIDVAKAVIHTDKTPEVLKIGGKRLLAALLIFIIPTLVDIAANIASKKTGETWLTCYNNASNYKDYEKKQQEAKILEDKTKRKEKLKTLIKASLERAKKREEEWKKEPVQYTGGKILSNGSNYVTVMKNIKTPTISELTKLASNNNISNDYLKVVIGTTYNEGYFNDPYLFYGWASAMINQPVTVDYMVKHWGGSYYGWNNINSGYNAALKNEKVMKSVYLAISQRNKKIVECHGMGSNQKLIYKSSVYNCSIYEKY